MALWAHEFLKSQAVIILCVVIIPPNAPIASSLWNPLALALGPCRHSLAFWHGEMFQAYLALPPPWSQNQTFIQRVCTPSNENWYLDTKVWVLDVTVTTGTCHYFKTF